MSGPAMLREEEKHRRSCNRNPREERVSVSVGLLA